MLYSLTLTLRLHHYPPDGAGNHLPQIACHTEHNGQVAYDEHLANRIREVVLSERGVTEQRMFGGLAFLINGNMAVSASGQGGLLLRVDPARTDELLRKPHARPFEM